MIYYQLMQFPMKKEEKSFHDLSKPRSIYKYELKATNEILTDTADLCLSALLSTAHTNRNNFEIYNDETDRTPPKRYEQYLDKRTLVPLGQKNFRQSYSRLQYLNGASRQIFEQYQLGRRQCKNSFSCKKRKQRLDEWEYIDRDAFINSEIYSFSEDNFSNPSKKPESLLAKSKSISFKKDNLLQSKKDLKRQRRGLADISLKVKNIVALMGKMTFKEVSDQVLKQSEEDLPNQLDEREKETKNIRRRVYDALNVLVSVGILGKEQRCVVHTQFTNVRGKKLSEHYDLVAERNRSLEQQIKTYRKKLDNLLLLKKNYQTLIQFQERNRRDYFDSSNQQLIVQGQALEKYCNSPCDRLYFPLIFLLPPKVMTQRIKIQIDYQDSNLPFARKFVIEGTDYILTDLDTLKYLKLPVSQNVQALILAQNILKSTPNEKKQEDFAIELDSSKSFSIYYAENEVGEDIYLSD